MIDLASLHHKPATESQVNRIPFDKLKGLNVDIHAPNPKDPGQLVRAWLQVTRVVDWISPWNSREGEIRCMMGNRLFGPRPWGPDPDHPTTLDISKNLPDISVRLMGGNKAWWTSEHGFQRSITGPISESMIKIGQGIDPHNFHESDAHILLQPFQRIRYARSLNVLIPLRLQVQCLDYPALLKHIQRLNIVGRWQLDFGDSMDEVVESERVEHFHNFGIRTNPDKFEISESLDDECIDNEFQRLEDTWTTWLDHCLDDLRGPTARFLRRERFWQWCEAYERFMFLALEGSDCLYEDSGVYYACRKGGLSIKMVSEAQEKVLRTAANNRLHALEALNPLSLELADPAALRQEPQNWSRVAWWSSYRNGIPRKSSHEYREAVGRMASSVWYEYDTYRGINFRCLYCQSRYDGMHVSLSDLINTK